MVFMYVKCSTLRGPDHASLDVVRQRMCLPEIARAMISCWISLVPSRFVSVVGEYGFFLVKVTSSE